MGPCENDDNIGTGHEMKQGPGSTPDEQHDREAIMYEALCYMMQELSKFLPLD